MLQGGVTEEAAAVISSVLRDKYGLVVDVVNLRENSSPDLVQYANVIIGSGVRMQKVYKEALKFLQNDFGDRRVAIFLSSGEAGDPKSYDQAITKYVKNVLAKYPHVRPVAAEAFGGRMAILGKTVSDSRNMEKVRVWAEELGKKLSD